MQNNPRSLQVHNLVLEETDNLVHNSGLESIEEEGQGRQVDR